MEKVLSVHKWESIIGTGMNPFPDEWIHFRSGNGKGISGTNMGKASSGQIMEKDLRVKMEEKQLVSVKGNK